MEKEFISTGALVSLIITALVVAGCTGPAQQAGPGVVITPSPSPAATGTSGDVGSVAEANNRFAFDLYPALAGLPDNASKNIFCSPFSISTALAITGEGANGKTVDEIFSVLHLPKDSATRRTGFAGLNAAINNASADYTLRTANALWAEKTYAFLPSYTGTARQYYSAEATNLDFIRAPEESRSTINRWVEEKTEEKIRDLLPQGSITPLTRLVITNAIYFKGTWARQFDVNLTRDADFTTSSGHVVKARMMQDTGDDTYYWYAETGDLQYIELPYLRDTGKSLSMVVLLPRGNDLRPAEATLSESNLSAIKGSARYRQVELYFPKFRVESEYLLSQTLSAMGMPTAFIPGSADLSGMDGTRDLYISNVFHKAFIDVNEEGTEAAAATAVVVKLQMAPVGDNPPVFRADHPFIFLIRDNESGAILFLGRVSDPAAG
ncbi:serpin family protein [Methanoregula sp.]|uniref:serpin family protein n=1 Tax=Methanoregula sp. TaxID=2052170 RepID=UPI00261865E4|nr:serpin family protein [Methanoregula sp.]MDD5143996.1 serpin family protein [Methanoregula sp.]